MADFGQMELTNQGRTLLLKTLLGEPLNFTKLEAGQGLLVVNQDIKALTALINFSFDIPISSVSIDQANNLAVINATADNTGFIQGVNLKEIGVFATDPEVGEILYAYANAGSFGDYIPPITRGVYSRTFAINTTVANVESVTATLPSQSYAAIDDFNLHVEDDTQHVKYVTTSNVGNAYYATVPNLKALTDGLSLRVKFNAASTGAITVNPNALFDIPVVDFFNTPVTNVRTNVIANLSYDIISNSFILLGRGGGGDVTSGEMLLGVTATSNLGPVVGSIRTKTGLIYMPTVSDQTITTGFEDGTCKVVGDVNHIPGNIKAGITDFGVVGSANMFNDTDRTSLIGLANQLDSDSTPIKNSVVANIGSPTLVTDLWSKINTDIVVQKTNLSTNLVARGKNSVNTETLKSLVDKTVIDPNVIPSNIMSGKTIDGVAGGIPNFASSSHDSGSVANYGNGDVAVYLATSGYYPAGIASSGGGEVKIPVAQSGLIASKILSGQTVFGLAGTVTVESLGGHQYATAYVNFNSGWNAVTSWVIPNIYFTPTFLAGIVNQNIGVGNWNSGFFGTVCTGGTTLVTVGSSASGQFSIGCSMNGFNCTVTLSCTSIYSIQYGMTVKLYE